MIFLNFLDFLNFPGFVFKIPGCFYDLKTEFYSDSFCSHPNSDVLGTSYQTHYELALSFWNLDYFSILYIPWSVIWISSSFRTSHVFKHVPASITITTVMPLNTIEFSQSHCLVKPKAHISGCIVFCLTFIYFLRACTSSLLAKCGLLLSHRFSSVVEPPAKTSSFLYVMRDHDHHLPLTSRYSENL